MQKILSVFELTSEIKKILENGFSSIQVKGEISNLKEQASGHIYFTLKDAHAQISAVLFRGNARDLKKQLKNGDQVMLQGELNVYPSRGYYQIIVRKLEHLGVGELLMQLHALKLKLHERGWFASAHKKKLPKYPRTIGVVTSATGSVIQDILHILNRRFSGFHLILNPVKVQGPGAAEEIAQAIADFNRYRLADVLIVGRGGGSLEDLWAFNEECVAAAIFHSHIPIIAAVGHETDVCIADFVADVRAPTPSAAAEIATQETASQLQFLHQARNRLKANLRTIVDYHAKQLMQFKRHPVFFSPLSLIEPHLQRMDDLRSDVALSLQKSIQEKHLKLLILKKQALALSPSNQVCVLKNKLDTIERSLMATLMQHFSTCKAVFDKDSCRKNIDIRLQEQILAKRRQLHQLCSHLRGIDPKNLLTKGYCILFREKSDSVILSTEELHVQESVRLQLQDGQAFLTVNGIKK